MSYLIGSSWNEQREVSRGGLERVHGHQTEKQLEREQQGCGKMVFSLRGGLGRRIVELDEPPLKEPLCEPNWSTYDLINISHAFLTQVNEKQFSNC